MDMKNILSRDDWSLTLKGLKDQRVQLLLQLAVVEAGIDKARVMVDSYPAPSKKVSK